MIANGRQSESVAATVTARWVDPCPFTGCLIPRLTLRATGGQVTSIVRVDGCTAESQEGRCCITAITKPSPYGKWTDDMIAKLGTEQEMTFVFYYQ
jgi:hypothetical protein